MNKLIVTNLQKRFRKREVVKNLSLEVNGGEIVGLLGPNGAGKTTAFYMIVGLISVGGGQIFFNNKNITKMPTYMRARLGLGYLPQEASIFRKLTVKENILAILQLKNLTKAKQYSKLNMLLNEFHISHIKDSLGVSLSGGERRRVEIARALASEPKFILLDEPFAGIDPISVIDLKNIISQLCKKNIGVLITDHNVRETLDVCNRAYIVSDGTVLCSGTPEIILNNQQVREIYLGKDFTL